MMPDRPDFSPMSVNGVDKIIVDPAIIEASLPENLPGDQVLLWG